MAHPRWSLRVTIGKIAGNLPRGPRNALSSLRNRIERDVCSDRPTRSGRGAAALELIDLLIDEPFIAALGDSAGPWTGSGNQRVVDLPATRQVGEVVAWTTSAHTARFGSVNGGRGRGHRVAVNLRALSGIGARACDA